MADLERASEYSRRSVRRYIFMSGQLIVIQQFWIANVENNQARYYCLRLKETVYFNK